MFKERVRGVHSSHWLASSAPGVFRALHESGCFILPNPWDIGSAVYLHHLGFKALATTSAGFAFSRGLPDSMNALSIEDGTGDNSAPLYERGKAIERIRAARASIDETKIPVVLTARCEAWLVGDLNPGRTALDRLTAFADAGADCLYAPGVRDPGMISTIVKAVAPKSVNVLISSPIPGLSFSRLADLGVRRISVGSALARVAWTSFIRAARNIAETGTFDALEDAVAFSELNSIFKS